MPEQVLQESLTLQALDLDSKLTESFVESLRFVSAHCRLAHQLLFRNGDTVVRAQDSMLVFRKLKKLEKRSKVLELPHFLLLKLQLSNHFQQLPNHFSEFQKLSYLFLLCHKNIRVQRLL